MNFQYLTEYIDNLFESEGIPSRDIIVYQKGKEIYRHSAGYQDLATGEPIRRDALYFMYSASKLLTIVATMQLLERGKILLQEKVSKYLPEYSNLKVKAMDERGNATTVPARHSLRIWNLMTMTSGIAYNTKAPEILACMEEHNGAPTTADIIKAFAVRPLNFHPSEHWMYGFSHDVLARVIEVVTGESFGDYVKKNIFDPIGMTNSYYHLTDDLRPRMAAQYKFDAELGKAVDVGLNNAHIFGPKFESGGAGCISCLDDYILFAETLTHKGVAPNGNRILSERAVDLMRSDCLDDRTRPDFNWEAFVGYGYGFGVRTFISPAKGGSLTSLGEFAWGGAAGAYVHCDPEKEISIVYLQHMLNNKEPIVHPRLRNLVYAALDY
ncbi:MAG: beta-lactamase family protein [Clostridia bacterium]|nr:beta-lactamase family protein [Clostridia bacterium]